MMFLLGVPVKWVGVGQARDAMILRSDSWGPWRYDPGIW